MKRIAFLWLSACSADVFTSIGRPDVEIDAGTGVDVETQDSAIDSPLDGLDSSIDVASEEASMCATDGGACTAGSCCAGLHCFAGKCTSCKPDGVIALSASECCNPGGFANAACGGVKTCAAPNYDKCGPSNNGLACCGGAQCKQNAQIWSCGCGPTDAPCHVGNDFECCSNVCDAKGWCQ